ncbi:methyl-accepting chemotaxis protein [Geomonas anaerohicana]|uniref:Methyl-accepting chemotaxis protein n=1 Tax=Geomonas anaerohicana TaxID=2798583 RepID=A0ABS0YHD4_9BACT|nr:methyl-accepting chemotaxis protein [Geomonas anaerohicana]MBJ6751544.1 methyl-accepting chemotaxis protein [Geomonas anaerohicana]
MPRLSIGTKLTGGFLLVAFISLLVGGFGYLQIHKINDADTFLYQKGLTPVREIGTIATNFQRLRVNLRDIVLATDQKDIQQYDAKIKEFRGNIDKACLELQKALPTEETKKLFAHFLETRKAFTPHVDKIVALAGENKDAEATEYIKGAANKAVRDEMDAIDNLEQVMVKEGQRISDSNTIVADRAGRIMIGLAVAGFVVAFLLGMMISRSITVPLRVLVGKAQQVSDGDLLVSIDNASGDEVGELADAFKSMTENLRGILGRVAETSNQVASASSQLQATSEQIATGAEEVAAQAGTVATAGEEMSATSADIAQSCQMAAAGAKHASVTAENGAVVVERTVAVMNQIAEKVQASARTVESLGERSDQIGAIIGTIEDIADQTNLLALNAAIEAARAGEQGRGFAVVADEVRALAERTTRATREIGEMIKGIQSETKGAVSAMVEGVQQVETGTEEAAKSGAALQDILSQINEVRMQINQVATAAEEQTATTGEISSNIMQITAVVQQTARGAQECAGAASMLSGNSVELQRLVHQFKL